MLSPRAVEVLKSLDQTIGEEWFHQACSANACDDVLHVINADGVFTTKIDGFIHAATLTTPFLLKHLAEMEGRRESELDLERVTSWQPTDAAMRFAQWQVEFHWKIDTRLWQYLLYAKFMRRAYEAAIRAAEGLEEVEKGYLLDGSQRFWDAVEIAYCYRQETIERSRRFAPHPDKTAGASERGYVYRPIVPEPSYEFSRLRFELIGPELGAGTEGPEQVPVGFPKIPGVRYGELTESARAWVAAAKRADLCDDYLRVRLGQRWVPTRLNGWEAALADLRRYIAPSNDDPLVAGLRGPVAGESGDEVVPFFVQAQAEFNRRLNGSGPSEVIELVESAVQALGQLLAGLPRGTELVTTFLQRVREISDSADTQTLPERYEDLLDLVRPIHPRYAALDPLEPLPWHAKNPERYLQRMRRLGYEL